VIEAVSEFQRVDWAGPVTWRIWVIEHADLLELGSSRSVAVTMQRAVL
jgi:hypothetical protein